jgi:pyrimidine deaminase RibD-like protein
LLDHSDSKIAHIDLDGYHNRFGKADTNVGRSVRGRTILSEPEFVFGDQTESAPEEDFLQLGSNANDDRQFMELAIEEARKSTGEDGRSHPKVGAVIVKDGRVLAKAYRGEIPGCHAEYIALEKKLADQSLAGTTVYTTLEPCTSRNHPKIPCAIRLIERKVARVVIGILDPNPKISGRGQRALRKARIATDFFPHDLMEKIEELNREFTRHQESQEQSSAPAAAKEPDRFLALEELAGQLVEELSSYRPLDRTVLVPWFDEFRRAPGKFVRYSEVRINALNLQNVLDRMFVAKRDHEDGQPELRAELDAALKALLTACDQAREIADEHPKTADQEKNYDTPLWKVVEFISSRLYEQKDGNFFPKSRAYIRQHALNGKLLLWGREQLDLPEPYKEIRNFSNVLRLIPRGYWAISQLSAACTVPQEYADRIPFTLQEQSGSWTKETNSYSDIHANWQQVQRLVIESQKLPAKCPKIRPVSYGRESGNNSKAGLIIVNDGEPAYDISIPDIQLGEFRIQATPQFTRLTKEDGAKFCEVSIENRKGTIYPGEALLELMRLRNFGNVRFPIRFRDSDGNWHVTTCRLDIEARMIGGISSLQIAARFERQELDRL